MTSTVEEVNEDPPESRNIFRNFFERVIGGFQKLCCGKKRRRSSRTHLSAATSTRHEEEIFHINLRPESGGNFEATFSNSCLADFIREDNEFARQLQQQERRIRALPLGPESVDEGDLVAQRLEHPATFYRNEAQKHHNLRREYYQYARRHLKANNRREANFYFQLVKEQTRLFEQANNLAAAGFLAENGGRHPKKNAIDLHHLYVKEAIQALDVFLDEAITSLQDEGLKMKNLVVVTGRGKHSTDGIPKVKPAVIQRLGERRLEFSEKNPGCLTVCIYKHSPVTKDLT